MPAFRFVGIRQRTWRISPDDSFRRRVTSLVQSRYAKNGRDAEQKAREAILNHPYLDFDKWRHAEELSYREELTKCRRRRGELARRLQEGAIRYVGIDDQSGDPELTAKRLRDRKIASLIVSADLLFVVVPRHPARDTVLWQSWLYSGQASTLELLDVQDIAEIVPDRVLVTSGTGWRDPATALEDDFSETVRQILGLEGLASIRKLIDADAEELAAPSEKTARVIQERYGINLAAVEEARRAAFEEKCLREFGPRTEPSDLSIRTAKFRLEYERRRNTSEPGSSSEPV
jgi:hypothetical protein